MKSQVGEKTNHGLKIGINGFAVSADWWFRPARSKSKEFEVGRASE